MCHMYNTYLNKFNRYLHKLNIQFNNKKFKNSQKLRIKINALVSKNNFLVLQNPKRAVRNLLLRHPNHQPAKVALEGCRQNLLMLNPAVRP